MPDVFIYEGKVRLKTTDKNGNPLTVKSGQNAGKPWAIIAFKDGDTWVDIPDYGSHWKEIGPDTVVKVAYQTKVDDFGDPVLYNDKPQYVLSAVKVVSGGASPAEGGGQQTGGGGKSYDSALGARQTALNNATQLEVALIGAGVGSEHPLSAIGTTADLFHQWLTTGQMGTTVEELKEAAKEKLDAVELDDDIPF
jgi:hypothetical protein